MARSLAANGRRVPAADQGARGQAVSRAFARVTCPKAVGGLDAPLGSAVVPALGVAVPLDNALQRRHFLLEYGDARGERRDPAVGR